MVRGKSGFILFKELLRTLKKEWKQLFSIIAISFLSICLFSGLFSNALNLSAREDKVYHESNMAEIYVNTTSYDENDYAYISSLSGVKAERRISLLASNANSTLNVDAINLVVADDSPSLSIPILTSGESGALVMNKFIEDSKYKIGDVLSLSVPNALKGVVNVPSLNKDTITLNFEITGTMYHCEGVQNSSFSSPLVYVNKSLFVESISKALDDLPDLFKPYISTFVDGMFNQIIVGCDNADTVLEQIRTYYSSKDNNNLVIAMEKNSLPSYQALRQDVDQSMKLTFVFPLIFFLVSVLVIITTLSQMIIKQRSQIGCLKALGVKKNRIYVHYMVYGALLCFIGGILGFFIGPLIIPRVLNIKYDLLWDIPTVGISFLNLGSILMLISTCIVAALCSFGVSYFIVKEKPVDTLRPKVQHIKTKASKHNSFFGKHVGLSTKMALRNIRMNKGKSLMVMIGTMGCSALLVCGFGIMDTINHCVSVDYDKNQNIELVYRGKDIGYLKDKYQEIESIEKVYTYPINIANENYATTNVFLVQKETNYFTPMMSESGVTIDQTTAKKIGVDVGDEVKIVISGKTISKKVANVFKSSVLHGVFDFENDYEEDVKINYSQYIYLKDKVDLNEFKNELTEKEELVDVLTLGDIKEEANEILASIKLMTNVVKVFAILLCIVVIYNLTSLNVSKMSRDIATMKVLGLSYNEINGTLTKEIMFDTLIGTAIGLLLGFPMTVLVMMVNKTELLTFLYHVGWLSYLLSFVIAIGTSFIVSLLLNLKAKKIKMVESLKSVE